MKKKASIIVSILVLFLAVVGPMSWKARGAEVEPLCWYGMMAHPYMSLVQNGVEACSKDYNVKIYTTVGQEWTQGNETQNVEALSTKGYKGFSIFPADPTGANGLFQGLKKRDILVVAFGAEPNLPTPASFTVATDIKGAAMRACEDLIKIMGDKGNILNVLETVTDVNTKKRDDGIKEVVAKHANVHIIQTISDMTQQSVARNKIESALAARGNEIDGMIATGYNPTVAAAALLSERHKNPQNKKIHFIGIDTDATVLQAIRNGYIDGTIAQNPFGHGYISCALLKLMLDGWKPVKPYQFIEAGDVLITKENVETYAKDVDAVTEKIKGELTTKYLSK